MSPNRVPKYGRHKGTGQARVVIDGRHIYLGPYGSDESKRRYREAVRRWQDRREAALVTPDLSVGQLVLLYDGHVREHYVKNGRPTSEQLCIKAALRFIVETDRNTLIRHFGPRRFKAVRVRMIAAGLCRRSINQNGRRIRRLFRWGVSEELVPADVLAALEAVDGLKAGRTQAREKAPIGPVDLRDVIKIHRLLSRQVIAMIVLQLRTGARPGEIVQLRGRDLDMEGETWTFTPSSHKMEHQERQRVIFLGRRAQRIVRRFLKPDLDAYLFSPIDAERERSERRRAARQSPLTPSQAVRKGSPNRRRGPRDHYTAAAFRRAVARACRAAGVDRWSPNQCRHWTATRIRREAGIEPARAVLGHSDSATTLIYAEQDLQAARKVMARIG
jgi:integrase